VSGDDVRSSNKPDAQKMMPAGAGTARTTGGNADGDGTGLEISWVGQQHLMWGYCGRVAAGQVATPRDERTPPPAATARPVALLQRPRNLVVRIGPRPAAETADAPARAA
jgi:hypothetical protein